MRLSQFDFALPENLIAQVPLPQREDSKLLVAGSGEVQHRHCRDLPQLLRAGDVVVVNDTRVIPARLHGVKPTGGKIEILLERIHDGTHALVQLGSNKPIRVGQRILVGAHELVVTGREERFFMVCCASASGILQLFLQSGQTPLPPYIQRPPEAADRIRYQTVYARHPGAVAAPTAGLHLSQEMIEEIRARGVHWAAITLHVGAGTFSPVKAQDLAQHRMHREWIDIPAATCDKINQARQRGNRVVAIGTTVVRALESIPPGRHEGRTISPFCGDTTLFIQPGFQFRVVDALLTNFHLPRSTLLMMVCAFAGYRKVMDCYRLAVASEYRFFSYGDAMFIERALPAAGHA